MTDRIVYSPTVLEHYRHPRNRGDLAEPDLTGEADNPLCGDRIRITIRIEAGRIADARFRADACAICTAAASLLTERIRGSTLAAAAATPEDELIASLSAEIRPERRRCAVLPLDALRGVKPAQMIPGLR